MKEFKKKNLIYKISKLLTLLLSINLVFLIGCASIKKNENKNICSSSSLPCLLTTEYVLLITNKGKIKIELYGQFAPITVGNFVDYVEKGAYDRTVFNQVIKKPYPFVIRGGDNSLIKGENKFIDKKSGKIRYIPLEIKLKTNDFPTYNKEIDISNQKNNIELKHKKYYVSMARLKKVNSASNQFYISLKSLPELDGRFAVFGKVIDGMHVIDLIKEKDYIIEAKRL